MAGNGFTAPQKKKYTNFIDFASSAQKLIRAFDVFSGRSREKPRIASSLVSRKVTGIWVTHSYSAYFGVGTCPRGCPGQHEGPDYRVLCSNAFSVGAFPVGAVLLYINAYSLCWRGSALTTGL